MALSNGLFLLIRVHHVEIRKAFILSVKLKELYVSNKSKKSPANTPSHYYGWYVLRVDFECDNPVVECLMKILLYFNLDVLDSFIFHLTKH